MKLAEIKQTLKAVYNIELKIAQLLATGEMLKKQTKLEDEEFDKLYRRYREEQ